MTRIMLGPLLLIAATVSPAPAASPPAEGASQFRPVTSATASATVSIRIISGVRFGADQAGDDAGGSRRKAQLTDAAGIARPAELLEFQ